MTRTDTDQTLRPMTMVRRIFDERVEEYWRYSPFAKDQDYIFLGEILQMPGHGVFIDMQTGQIYSGYHIDDFRASRDDETSVTFTVSLEGEEIATDA